MKKNSYQVCNLSISQISLSNNNFLADADQIHKVKQSKLRQHRKQVAPHIMLRLIAGCYSGHSLSLCHKSVTAFFGNTFNCVPRVEKSSFQESATSHGRVFFFLNSTVVAQCHPLMRTFHDLWSNFCRSIPVGTQITPDTYSLLLGSVYNCLPGGYS